MVLSRRPGYNFRSTPIWLPFPTQLNGAGYTWHILIVGGPLELTPVDIFASWLIAFERSNVPKLIFNLKHTKRLDPLRYVEHNITVVIQYGLLASQQLQANTAWNESLYSSVRKRFRLVLACWTLARTIIYRSFCTASAIWCMLSIVTDSRQMLNP